MYPKLKEYLEYTKQDLYNKDGFILNNSTSQLLDYFTVPKLNVKLLSKQCNYVVWGDEICFLKYIGGLLLIEGVKFSFGAITEIDEIIKETESSSGFESWILDSIE